MTLFSYASCLFLLFPFILPQVSYSSEKINIREESLESTVSFSNPASVKSEVNQPDVLELVRINLGNKISEDLVYAYFDKEQQEFVIVCESEDEQYRDAGQRCSALNQELAGWHEFAGFNNETAENLMVSNFPVKLKGLTEYLSTDDHKFGAARSDEFAVEEELFNKAETSEERLQGQVHSSLLVPSIRLNSSGKDYSSGINSELLSDHNDYGNGDYSKLKIGAGILGIVAIFGLENTWNQQVIKKRTFVESKRILRIAKKNIRKLFPTVAEQTLSGLGLLEKTEIAGICREIVSHTRKITSDYTDFQKVVKPYELAIKSVDGKSFVGYMKITLMQDKNSTDKVYIGTYSRVEELKWQDTYSEILALKNSILEDISAKLSSLLEH